MAVPGSSPIVSVLLPARNAGSTLGEALAGLLGQRDAPPFELVLVDDASSDATPALIARACGDAGSLGIPCSSLRGEGRGLVAALQLGLLHCRGSLVARMDADDLVHPDRLRLQADALARNPALGAVGSLVRLIPRPLTAGLARLEEWLDSVVSAEECARARFIEAPLVHPSITFRRSALEAVGGYRDAGWAEDWDLLLRLHEAGFALAKIPQVLLWWRDGEARLTRTGAAYREEEMVRLRAHHLAHGPLRGRPLEIWGAGPTGKKLARALEQHGVRPRRFIDIDPRKLRARGASVVQAAEIGRPGDALLVCAVGAAGARETIRAELDPRGWREGSDYFFAA